MYRLIGRCTINISTLFHQWLLTCQGWQGRQRENSSTSHNGLHQFSRIPFGLQFVLVAFQLVLDVILSAVKEQYDFLYLNGIVIFSGTPQDPFRRRVSELHLLKDTIVTHQPNKSAFCTNQIDYPGHMIKSGYLKVSNNTAGAICELQVPTIVTDL